LLLLALQEGGDDNPFQDLGIDRSILFSVIDAAFRGRAERAINQVLAKFADRIQLAPDKPILFEIIPGTPDKDPSVEVSFEYVDLTTDKVEEFRNNFGNRET